MFRMPFSRRTNRPDPQPLAGGVKTMQSAPGFTADVPMGPPCPPLVNPGTLLDTAWQRGVVDADKGIHDPLSLQHEAELVYFLDVDHQIHRAIQHADLSRHDAEQSAAWLLVQKNALAKELQHSLKVDTTALDTVKTRLDRYRGELMGEGEYADSTWKDPTRVDEPQATTQLKAFLPPALLALAEVGVNTLALQTLGGGLPELVGFAVVLGAATITAGHAAGTHARVHARDGWRQRWLVPAGLAVLVIGVVLFVASLRVALVNAPQINPTTGSSQASMLTQAGVAPWMIWFGLIGLQLIFFAITAIQASSVHNPVVRALQRVRAEVNMIEERLQNLVRQDAAAKLSVDMAVQDQERIPAQWESYTKGLKPLGEQMKTTYAIAYTQQSANPDITVAMEARTAARWADLGSPPPSADKSSEPSSTTAPQDFLAALNLSRSEYAAHPNGAVPTARSGGN